MIVNNDLNSIEIFNLNSKKLENKDYNIFESIFNSTLNLLEETNSSVSYAEKLQIDYVTGESDDIIALNMAQSRASFMTQFASQVTEKVLTAYKEIMSMNI